MVGNETPPDQSTGAREVPVIDPKIADPREVLDDEVSFPDDDVYRREDQPPSDAPLVSCQSVPLLPKVTP